MNKLPPIGVVGLGAMGLGIAQLYAQAGHTVIATDSQPTARDMAMNHLWDSLRPRVEAGKLDPTERDRLLARIKIADDLSGFEPAHLVVEAIVEKLEAKQKLFVELEKYVNENCVLATNTSSLSVAKIMSGLRWPRRGIGLHFFNPVPVMKLVELVSPQDADVAALETARSLTVATGKTVILCADTPGFIVNRCARPFYGEALAMFEEGRSCSDIDAAMQADGYRLGPFSLIDLVGADINLAATQSLSSAMHNHPRYHVFNALKAQVANGHLGRKSGQGFLFPEKAGAAPADSASIVLRIEAALANEAASLAGVGLVSADDIDTAMKLGLNFPRGPFESTRLHGIDKIIAKLRELDNAAPSALKGRYRVMPMLEAIK